MNSLDEYMNRVSKLLVEVDEKDELVTEAIKKLDRWEQRIRKYRLDERKRLEESRQQLTIEQDEYQREEFKVEQLREMLDRMIENNSRSENEIKSLAPEINKYMEKLTTTFNDEREQYQKKRQVLCNKIEQMSNRSNNSNE